MIHHDKEQKDYVLGETKVVVGPRADTCSNDFGFSMRGWPMNDPHNNDNIKWALECSVEKAELTLFDLRNDPLERNNVAGSAAYQDLAAWYRQKPGKIVLGDGGVACAWSKANAYSLSNFASGADDKILDIPQQIIPEFNKD